MREKGYLDVEELVQQVSTVAMHEEDDCFGRALGLQPGNT